MMLWAYIGKKGHMQHSRQIYTELLILQLPNNTHLGHMNKFACLK